MISFTVIDFSFLAIIYGLVVFTAGMIMALYFTSKGMNKILIQQRMLGMFFVLFWATLTSYTQITKGVPLDWFINASGAVAVAYVLGLDVGEIISKWKK